MTERGASKGPVIVARGRLSSARICAEVLHTIDRIYASEGPDEPDLGLNVAYTTARASIQRLASARPWMVPASTASLIREAIASIAVMRDPQALEAELLSFPTWVFRLLDRRRLDRRTSGSTGAHRRMGDLRRHQSPAARLVWVPTRTVSAMARTPS